MRVHTLIGIVDYCKAKSEVIMSNKRKPLLERLVKDILTPVDKNKVQSLKRKVDTTQEQKK